MSFFGFDTALPPGGGDSLDERLRRMAEADENLEIYDWDDDTGLQGVGGGGLAGKLDESLDAFNDDTFGMPEQAEVGRDFDFAANTAHYLGEPVPTASSASARQASAKPQQQQQQRRGPASPFSISFDADPLLGPVQANRGQQQRSPFYQQPPVHQQQAQQAWARQDPAIAYQGSPQPMAQLAPRQPPQHRTLEEIEAEMQAAQQAKRSAQASPAPGPPRTPLTVEEVEAEMMRKAQMARQPQFQQQAQQAIPPQEHHMARQGSRDPGAVQVLAQQAQMMSMRQQQHQQQAPQEQAKPAQQSQQFPPLNQQAPPQGDNLLAQLLAATPQGQQMQQAGISLHEPQMQQAMEERMRANAALEEARRRKAAKIHRMAKYNGVMTQGDKDFITRIQVSQLINSNGPNGTHDPYSDDFYFAVIQSMRQARLAAIQQANAQNGGAPPGGPQQGPGQQPLAPIQQGQQGRNRNNMADKRMTRRENAMNRMTQQVQRLVDDAKKKPRASNLSLDGALGKIAVRTRSAPRPLLQVDNNKRNSLQSLDEKQPLSAADLAGSLASSLPARTSAKRGAALTRKETLAAIEHLYDIVLKAEQARRPLAALVAAAQAEHAAEEAGQPVSQDARNALGEQETIYKELVEEMWKGLKVMEPLDECTPHPFISLISITKGKKLLPRVLRHISYQQTLVLLTLLIATFDTLDVVRDAPILDMNPNDPAFYATSAVRGAAPLNVALQKKTRKQVENETELFLKTAMPLVMEVIAQSQLRIISGMLGLLIERNDLIKIAKTKPGLAFITVFISGAQTLKSAAAAEGKPAPEQSEIDQWTGTFNHLVSRLSGHLPSLFPSTRSMPFGPGMYTTPNSASAESILDAEDEPVWHFLAALAVNADMNQQQQLVTEVRDKVLENVMKAKSAAKQVETQGALAESVAKAKIDNVNTFLHALGLDASQITVD